MKIIHKEGFSSDELISFKSVIYSNTISAMRVMIEAAAELQISIHDTTAAEAVASIGIDNTGSSFTLQMGNYIKILWKDPGIQQVYFQNNRFQLIDSAS